MKSKNKLNSIYGMMIQMTLREEFDYDFMADKPFTKIKYNESEKEDKYYANLKSTFLAYQWGVWVTAWARRQLERGIELVHEHGTFLYGDTDSVKFFGDVDFTKYNDERIAKSKSSGAYAKKDGKVYYMGIYDKEDDMTEFATLGAKRYCYRTVDGKLHVTVSGLNKKKSPEELEEMGGVGAFNDGITFKDAGGLTVKYNDQQTQILYTTQDGHEIEITCNTYLCDRHYTLGLSAEYERLLDGIPMI